MFYCPRALRFAYLVWEYIDVSVTDFERRNQLTALGVTDEVIVVVNNYEKSIYVHGRLEQENGILKTVEKGNYRF